jgi:hypothetical protein
MKIFVAYGFNARDQWIPDLVFPLVRVFGAEVLTGEQAYDGTISDVVTERIKDANALLAFTTRRGNQRLPDGSYETHRWVTDELAYALALNRPAVEVREAGVSAQRGLAGDRQPIVYEEAMRDRCLVEVAKAVGAWCRGVTLSFAPGRRTRDPGGRGEGRPAAGGPVPLRRGGAARRAHPRAGPGRRHLLDLRLRVAQLAQHHPDAGVRPWPST